MQDGKGLQENAAIEFRERIDAVFYLLDVPCFFSGPSQDNHFNIGRSSTLAMDHFDQALNFIQAGRLDEARIYLEELLKQDPEDVDLLYNLGMLYTELGKSDMSIKLLKQCIEISPRHANAYVAMGFANMSSGDLKSAKEYTLEALKIVPDNPFAHRNLGGILGKENGGFRITMH